MIDRELHANALQDVTEERQRQDAKWKDDPEWDIHQGTKLAVLMEEVGEVANAILEHPVGHPSIRAELVQVAAVAVKWIESIDANAAQGDA